MTVIGVKNIKDSLYTSNLYHGYRLPVWCGRVYRKFRDRQGQNKTSMANDMDT